MKSFSCAAICLTKLFDIYQNYQCTNILYFNINHIFIYKLMMCPRLFDKIKQKNLVFYILVI